MPPTLSEAEPSSEAAEASQLGQPSDARSDDEPDRNFMLMAAYQILMRTGWIFKTESIIMPAVVDSISGAGWVRGWLPLLNRLGNGVAPILLARRLKIMPRKQWALFAAASCMATGFLTLAVLFNLGLAARPWMPVAFLAIYAAFFMSVGANQISLGTLQGKLVRTRLRGRLLLVANTVGAATAIACAYLLLPGWLEEDAPRFDLVFGFAGALFAFSAVTTLFLSEHADQYHEAPPATVLHYFRDVYRTLAADRNFRWLGLVGALFGASLMLFPHYQNLGLRSMDLSLPSMMWWVVIQNLGTGVFSVPAGAIADRHGNRRVLRITTLFLVSAPTGSILLLHLGDVGTRWFPVVFLVLGMTPVVMKTLQNYTLEVCAPTDHPRYLGALSACIALPMVMSPLVGLCVDYLGFEVVFLSIAAVMLCGWGLTFWLHEPREHGKLTAADEAPSPSGRGLG